MPGVVQICNMALTNIKVSRLIQSIDEPSAEAATCKLWYDVCLTEMFEDSRWPFATRYAELALVGENLVPEWQYSYRYPSDCAYAQAIVRAVPGRRDPNPAPFVIQSDTQGKLISTDEQDAVLRYTARITNDRLYTTKFAIAMSWLLASRIGGPLSKSDKEIEFAYKQYRIERSAANAASGNEAHADQPFEAEWIRVRGAVEEDA